MNTAAATFSIQPPFGVQCPEPRDVTLLELVGSVCEVTDDEDEVVAIVLHLIRSGRVRLCGNFRGSSGYDLA
jgi:hypothetical protein